MQSLAIDEDGDDGEEDDAMDAEQDDSLDMDMEVAPATTTGTGATYSLSRRHSDMVTALLIEWTPTDLAAMLKLVLQAYDFGYEHWQGAGDQLRDAWVAMPVRFDEDDSDGDDAPREDVPWVTAIWQLAQLPPLDTAVYRLWARVAILVALWLNEAVRVLFAASDARIRARFRARCLGPSRLRAVLDTVREELHAFAAERAYRGAADFLIACSARILHGLAPAVVLETPARRALMAQLLQLEEAARTTQ